MRLYSFSEALITVIAICMQLLGVYIIFEYQNRNNLMLATPQVSVSGLSLLRLSTRLHAGALIIVGLLVEIATNSRIDQERGMLIQRTMHQTLRVFIPVRLSIVIIIIWIYTTTIFTSFAR